MRTNLLPRTCLLAAVALAAACDSSSSYQSPTAPPDPVQPVPAPVLPAVYAGSITIQRATPGRDCIAKTFNSAAGRSWDLSVTFPGTAVADGTASFRTTLFGEERTSVRFQDQGGKGVHLDLVFYLSDFSLSDLKFETECVSFDGSSLFAIEMTLPPTDLASQLDGFPAGGDRI
jgi:hypothetical protein